MRRAGVQALGVRGDRRRLHVAVAAVRDAALDGVLVDQGAADGFGVGSGAWGRRLGAGGLGTGAMVLGAAGGVDDGADDGEGADGFAAGPAVALGAGEAVDNVADKVASLLAAQDAAEDGVKVNVDVDVDEAKDLHYRLSVLAFALLVTGKHCGWKEGYLQCTSISWWLIPGIWLLSTSTVGWLQKGGRGNLGGCGWLG